jgi:hypothetical protein
MYLVANYQGNCLKRVISAITPLLPGDNGLYIYTGKRMDRIEISRTTDVYKPT